MCIGQVMRFYILMRVNFGDCPMWPEEVEIAHRDFQYSDHTASYRQLESFVHRMMMMHGNLMNFMN